MDATQTLSKGSAQGRSYRKRLAAQTETAKARLDASGVPRNLRMPDVLAATGHRGPSTIYEKIKRGEFPAGYKLGSIRFWTPDQIATYNASRQAA